MRLKAKMEASRYLPEGETEKPEPQLSLIIGGQAVDAQVEIFPVERPQNPGSFESLMSTIPSEQEWADKTTEELLVIRGSLSQYMGQMARHIHDLTQEHDAALRKLIWLNGFIRDRR